MNTFTKDLYISIVSTVLFGIVLCGLYPLLVWGCGQLLFPRSAHGNLITNNAGKVIGSEMIGQNFAAAQYFHPRPSAAGNGYDATSSSGSNLGPTSQKLMDAVKARVESYRTENQLPTNGLIPADAVTASASGLDPHISLKNALLQLPRIAQARKMSPEAVEKEIRQATTLPFLNILGEPCVNVLQLNLALDSH